MFNYYMEAIYTKLKEVNEAFTQLKESTLKPLNPDVNDDKKDSDFVEGIENDMLNHVVF